MRFRIKRIKPKKIRIDKKNKNKAGKIAWNQESGGKSVMFVTIGRQPIYSRDFVVSSYEFLYRSNAGVSAAAFGDEDAATRTVVSNAINLFGLSELTDGAPAYVNFTRNLILTNLAYMARPDQIIVEVPGGILVDERLKERLYELKNLGYRISLGGYNQRTAQLKFNEIVHLFDFVRLNVRLHNRLQLRDLVSAIRRRSNAHLIMEQVESEADYDKVKDMDFLFERPVSITKSVDLAELSYGRIFNECVRPDCDFEICAAIIERDPMLTYMLLGGMPRFDANRLRRTQDIQRVVMPMGTNGIRKWACSILLKNINVGASDALPHKAYTRGEFLSRVIQSSAADIPDYNGFILGVFSLLDEIMGISKEELFGALHIPMEVRDALMDEHNEYYEFLRCVRSYEKSYRFPDDARIHMNLSAARLNMLYEECARETDRVWDTTNPYVKLYTGNILR